MNKTKPFRPLIQRPVYNNEYAKWIGTFAWTHFVTLSDNLESRFGVYVRGASQEKMAEFESMVGTYVYRLGERTFGRKAKRSIDYVAFLESNSKSGLSTAWHAHLLVAIPDNYCANFLKEAARQWGRITRRCVHRNGIDVVVDGSVDIQPIYHLAGAASYVSKFASDERAPLLMNLPAAGNIVVDAQ